jgi:hypothetical protein
MKCGYRYRNTAINKVNIENTNISRKENRVKMGKTRLFFEITRVPWEEESKV